MTKFIIYVAGVTETLNNNTTYKKAYIGLREDEFKNPYAKHMNSFRHRDKSKATKLDSYLWILKDKKILPVV